MPRLVFDLRMGESLVLEGGLTVTLQQKSGQLAKLCFESTDPMQIQRQGERRSAPREGFPGRRSTDGK
jgi:hypothetical protein